MYQCDISYQRGKVKRAAVMWLSEYGLMLVSAHIAGTRKK